MLSTTDNMIALKKIKTLSANIAGQLSIPEVDVDSWLKDVIPIIIDFHKNYGNRQFALTINLRPFKLSESEPLNSENLWAFISKGVECFSVDLNKNFNLSDNSSSELESISEYCYVNKVPSLLISGEEISLYNTEGRSVLFYNVLYPEATTRRRLGINARSYKEYKALIDEQGSKQLVYKMDEIWEDRQKRILVANRKTEKILQTFLAKWLNDNIYDAKIETEVGKISGVDRTDIEINGINTGDQIIIEVKWMGVNAAKSSYDLDRLKEGIKQVCVYLDREPTALEGCVVCYDGRNEPEKNNIAIKLDHPIARLDYKIVWLESKSASEIGVN